MTRCLILSCSQKKVENSGKLPAIQRYDGPPFRVLRKFLTDANSTAPHNAVDVFILSAEFALIDGDEPIPYYDRRMTPRRAEELYADVLKTFKSRIVSKNYSELFLSMGKTYLLALDGFETLLSSETKVIISNGGNGQKLADLKAWLNGVAIPVKQPSSQNGDNDRVIVPRVIRGAARLKGVDLRLTPDEVYQIARQSLADEVGNPHNFRNWYVLVDEIKVAPKWLVSQLANLPVREFDAGSARRVLKGLGIPVYRN